MLNDPSHMNHGVSQSLLFLSIWSYGSGVAWVSGDRDKKWRLRPFSWFFVENFQNGRPPKGPQFVFSWNSFRIPYHFNPICNPNTNPNHNLTLNLISYSNPNPNTKPNTYPLALIKWQGILNLVLFFNCHMVGLFFYIYISGRFQRPLKWRSWHVPPVH